MLIQQLMRIVIFSIVSIVLQQNTASAAQQPNVAAPRQQVTVNSNNSQSSVTDASIPTTSNPLCNDVANQIAAVSATTTATKVYPWENLDWLQKNLGPPKVVQSKESKAYMWICRNPSSAPGMVLYFVDTKMGAPQVMYESMICKPPEGCIGYGFERQGNNISGYKVKSEMFHN